MTRRDSARLIGKLLVLVLLADSVNARRSTVHSEMHEEELRRVFGTRNPEAVPEYEVASLRWPSLDRRDSDTSTRLRLNAFGKKLDLWLRPTEGTLATWDTPVYFAKTNGDRIYLRRILDAMSAVGKMLEDRRHRATLIVERSSDGRRAFISGDVRSEGWILKPLPDRFAARGASTDRPRRESSHPHVIFHARTAVAENGTRRIFTRQLWKREIHRRSFNEQRSKAKRADSPNVLYPQILVITDHATFQRHGKIARLLEYLLPFWNAVDLRYRDLEFPKVRLNIAGIIVAGDSAALPYLTRNKVSAEALNIVGALTNFGKFVSAVLRVVLPFAFDVAFTMSPLNMCQPKDSYCISGTLGYAYNEGACDADDYAGMDYGVAVVQDRGAFDGTQTAAHELGHLLGARHDGAGETPCSSEAGNVMAAIPILTAHSQDWSNCSLIALDNFFKSAASTCLWNEPKTPVIPDRVLPGSMMSLDEQCERLVGTRSCTGDRDPCVQLSCLSSEGPGATCRAIPVAAADGSKCGGGAARKICLHERCIDAALSFY